MRFPSLIRLLLGAVAVLACAGLLAACGGDDASGGAASDGGGSKPAADADALPGQDVSDADLKETIKKAFFADVAVDDMDPTLVNALKVAATPLTAEQTAKLQECMSSNVCDTGHGDLTVGIADSFGGIPWRVQSRLEATAQALVYPQVRKIIYTDGGGDLQKSLANFRSLMSQNVDVITGYFDFASSMLQLVRQANKQGIAVVTYIGPVPGAKGGVDMASQVIPDLCAIGTNMADKVMETGGEHKAAAMFTGVPGNSSATWEDCAQKAFEGNGWKIAHKGFTKWTPQGEIAAGSELISSGKPVDAILYDNTGANFFIPYERAKEPTPIITSWANSNQYYKAFIGLPEGSKENFIINGQTWTHRIAMTAGIEKKLGKEVAGDILLPQPMVGATEALPLVESTLDSLPLGYTAPTFSPEAVVQQVLK